MTRAVCIDCGREPFASWWSHSCDTCKGPLCRVCIADDVEVYDLPGLCEKCRFAIEREALARVPLVVQWGPRVAAIRLPRTFVSPRPTVLPWRCIPHPRGEVLTPGGVQLFWRFV